MGTAAISITIWDNATPRHLLTGAVEMDPLTYDITLIFVLPVSGSVVLLG